MFLLRQVLVQTFLGSRSLQAGARCRLVSSLAALSTALFAALVPRRSEATVQKKGLLSFAFVLLALFGLSFLASFRFGLDFCVFQLFDT